MNIADLQRAKDYLAAVAVAPDQYAFFAEVAQRWYVTRNALALETFGRALDARLSPPSFIGAWERTLHACVQMPEGWVLADGLTPSLLGDDTLSNGFVKSLASDSKNALAQLLREPVNGNDDEMLAQIEETIENALRARDILAARIYAKVAQPLPFASAA